MTSFRFCANIRKLHKWEMLTPVSDRVTVASWVKAGSGVMVNRLGVPGLSNISVQLW